MSDTDHLLGTAPLSTAVRVHAERLGVPGDHPALNGHLTRRLREQLESGRLRHRRIRNRYYVDPVDVPQAARLLGLHDASA